MHEILFKQEIYQHPPKPRCHLKVNEDPHLCVDVRGSTGNLSMRVLVVRIFTFKPVASIAFAVAAGGARAG
jgi:hypothetical protein